MRVAVERGLEGLGQQPVDQLRPGDVVVVFRLDRLARSTRDLLEIAEQLNEAEAGLRSLQEPWADTTSPAGRMVLTVFAGIAEFGDALMHAGFRDPVLDRDLFERGHGDLPALMRELRAIGATNALHARRHTLTGRARFAAAAAAYEPLRGPDGLLPASWEVITAIAWAPEPGAPIREGGQEVASFPASRIPIRRRS